MYPVSNIRRRFGLLFTLPSTSLNLILLTAVSSPIPILTYLSIGADTLSTAAALLGFELLIFASLGIERYVLRGNPLATFRRLMFTSFMSNGIWLTVAATGFLIHSEQTLPLLVLGAFYAVSFRLLVFGSVFFKRSSTAFFISLIQPVFLMLLLTSGLILSRNMVTKSSVYLGGSILIASVVIYLRLVNTSGGDLLKAPALTMLQAFLKAWSSDQPEHLEEIIEKSGSETSVKTNVIVFDTGGARSMLIVPEVHPGPFYPVGSSNLPFQMHEYLLRRGFHPLVLHGVSGHELNLTSKREVEHLLSSLDGLVELGGGDTCTQPLTVSFGRAVAHGVAFGEYAFITFALSGGMEDLPIKVKTSMVESASKLGFRHLILVDSHNSQGEFIGDEECAEFLKAGEELLKRLKGEKQQPFRVGYSHSSEVGLKFNRDIGPAGVGVFAIEMDGDRHLLVSVDANNAQRGLREEIVDHFKDSGTPIIELCTSDTHITAGKIMTVSGYVALGDETQADEIIKVVEELSARAVARLSDSKFQVKYADTDVKIIGEGMLDDISKAMDRVTKTAKRGGISLLAVSLAVILLAFVF